MDLKPPRIGNRASKLSGWSKGWSMSESGPVSMTGRGDGDTYEFEYASRGLVKYKRAAELFESLELEVEQWNDKHRLMAPARSSDGGDQRLELFRPPTLDEVPSDAWESTFHDGVHNLRVSLENLCYELCHLEQPAPKPGAIHFPITDHPNEWPDRTKHLDTIPAPLLERIRQCQPWARPDSQNPDPLRLISRIDNVDKHRASGVAMDVIPLGQWKVRSFEPVPPDLASSPDWPLTPWMAMTLDPPIEPGFAALMPVMAVPIVMFEGVFANLPDAQRWLHREVGRMIEYIASGTWPNEGFRRFLPEPTWSALPAT